MNNLRKEFESLGEETVRLHLRLGRYMGPDKAFAYQWLSEQEGAREEDSKKEDKALAKEANRQAKIANRIAIAALIVAIISTIIAVSSK